MSLKYIMGLLLCSNFLFGQGWQPAMAGMYPVQDEGQPGGFQIKFKSDGPLGRDWIYGNYLDEDSVARCIAYREGGKWVPLPFSGHYGNYATGLVMYGDTMYISGYFGNIVLDKDSSTLPNTNILKYYNDSLWSAPSYIYADGAMAAKGDTLLLWGGYQNPQDSSIIYSQVMTPDGGQTWQYPYTILHPTNTFLVDSVPDFGPLKHLDILDNGDILTLNNGSPVGSPFRGVSRWDGQQWQAYGNGVAYGMVHDFIFYKGDLYVGGDFARYYTLMGDTIGYVPQNPGNAIAYWDGSQWQNPGGGILEGGVQHMFVHDSILYCHVFNGYASHHRFGDALIPCLAGWDGQQWCGTPVTFLPAGFEPSSIGIVNDTLFASFKYGNNYGTANGVPVKYMMYYDGDYLHGPNAICSTPGLGEKELKEKVEVGVFPNPSHSFLQVTANGVNIKNISIFGISGKCVLQQNNPMFTTKLQVDISSLPNGIYLLKVNDKYNAKLVKD